MTRPTCPLCRGPGSPAFTVAGHDLHTCGRCATLFVAPLPPDDVLAAFYRSAEPELGSRLCWECSSRHSHATWARALAQISGTEGGAVLDVGCGTGQFLEFAKGQDVGPLHGLELAPAAAAAARQRSGATVHERGVLDSGLPAETFGGVTLWDVLEHLPDPRAALRSVRTLLRPGGTVVIGTPNRRGVSLRLLGRRSSAICPPEHLFVATARGLRLALAGEGLEVTSIRSEQVRLHDWSGRGGGSGTPGAPDRYQRAYSLLTGPLGRAAQRAANVLLGATGLGDQLIAVARRPPGPLPCA